ncbi:MAG TPA: PEP-CTERM sorting domain-containing protein [Verrucomicrobiae bacterium]|nr:PEP-CTERM sorting domain-containing protein [Verrucomicrobiae bacterium]
MKKGIVCYLLLCLSCAPSLLAQTFQNLDFEGANVPVLPINQTAAVSVTNGLPGWSAYIGTNQLTTIGENSITLGNANLGILAPNYLSPAFGAQFQPLQGLYSAILQAGGTQNQGAQPASIAQTGLIPAGVKSVQFEATIQLTFTNVPSDVAVAVGGVNTPIVPLGGNFYGCDISAFANSEEEISFSMLTNFGNGLMLLDAISFSTQAVPEPSALMLLVIGIGGLACWHRTRRCKGVGLQY